MTDIPPVLLAYCAGVIDSDGWIGVKRSTYEMRRTHMRGVSPQFAEMIGVQQVTPEAVDLLAGLFGGVRKLSRPKNRRPLHVWLVSHAQAAACLRAILPYLRIKRTQAENCLLLRDLKEKGKGRRGNLGVGRGTVPMPPSLKEAMEFCFVTAKRLNAVGIKAISAEAHQ